MRVDSPPVTIVSYSGARIPAVLDALANAKRRWVKVDLIFESPEHFDDAGGSHFYASYHWSFEPRPAPRTLLHAKSVIVDGHDTFVTSANLSNLAYQSSLELGLLWRGGGIAERVQRSFDALTSSGLPILAPSQALEATAVKPRIVGHECLGRLSARGTSLGSDR